VKTVLIIGASRGLGLELVAQYLAAGWRVLATARKIKDIKRLELLGANAYRVRVTNPADFEALKRILASKSINVAIYNAGVYGSATPRVNAIAKADFDEVMRTNVWGAMLAVPAIAPAVSRAKGVFAFVSSTMGSIAKMDGHNRIVYRASKSALNAVMKGASMEWADGGIVCAALHPGWVRTDMGGPNADIAPSESVTGVRKVIERLSQKDNGVFLDYAGKALKW
jgi:NAD(P)-dependent dehydrogenase (short-subunit alcohol dehydrogenase family)